jgi:uncharacterized protein (TIGR03067 family)
MKPLTLTIALFSMVLTVARAGEFDENDFDRMQGTWRVVSLTEKGKAVPAAETEVLEFVIEKNTFTAFEKGKMVVKYEIKLDPTKKPKQIDFTYLVGDDKGKTEPGIYQFEKGQIKFVLDEDKKGRPTVFEGKETEAYSVLVLKKK